MPRWLKIDNKHTRVNIKACMTMLKCGKAIGMIFNVGSLFFMKPGSITANRRPKNNSIGGFSEAIMRTNLMEGDKTVIRAY